MNSEIGNQLLNEEDHVIENELSEKELKETRSKSWFCVLCNPQEIYKGKDDSELTPEEICDLVVAHWCGNNESRSALVAYCISAKGLIHLHMCLCDNKDAQRFSSVKKAFPKANLRASKGTKADIENYIYKRGKWEDKGEQIVCTSQRGEIQGRQGQRTDINNIRELINQGYTPRQLFRSNINYRRYEKLVKDEYFDKKIEETPLMREVKVYWHVGEAGSGKSYESVKLAKQYGRDNIYIVNNYDGGKFDKYCGQKILFLDEFKGGITYQELLSILDKYTNQIHCRYSNSYMLWDEVHITSVFPPEVMYKIMVGFDEHDSYEQLRRRITSVVYHYKRNNEYCSVDVPIESYKDFASLKYDVEFTDFDDAENPWINAPLSNLA